MIIFCVTTIVVLISIYRYIVNKDLWKYGEKIPGDKSLPIVGNAHQVGNNPVEYLKSFLSMWAKYNYDLFRVWIGPQLFVLITNPKDVEVVLSSNKLIDKMRDYRFLHPWLGQGLLTGSGEHWFKHRRMITPSFHFKILNDFHDVFTKGSSKFIEKLKENADGKTFDIQRLVHLCTLDVICESAMGVEINAMDDPESQIVTSIETMCHIIQNRFFSIWKRFDPLFRLSSDYQSQKKALNILLPFNDKVIRERQLFLENNRNSNENLNADDDIYKKKLAFLDTLLTATVDGKPLTNEQIGEEVSTFMFEGHDTTASGVSFAIYLLSKHAAEQEKLLEEQKQIIGSDLSRDATFQEMQEMKYLDLFVKEAQRIFPSVPMVGRLAQENFDLNGKTMPAGAAIVIFIIAIGRNPENFKDPLRFWPERFLPENRLSSHPYEYVPFSAGPRNCVGQKFAVLELKTIIAKLVRSYEILPSDDPTYEPILASVLTLRSHNGIQIRLKPRK